LARRGFVEVLFATSLAAYASYVAAIGGDRFDFRFLVPVLPLFYWLVVEGGLALARRTPGRWGPHVASAALVAGLLLLTQRGSNSPEARVERGPIESLPETRRYGRGRIEQGRFLRSLVERGLLPADLRLAVSGAGAVPYYTRWFTVDSLGLNDATIAHGPVAARGLPGHEHKASLAYLAAKRVALNDVFNRIVYGGDLRQLRERVLQSGVADVRCLRADERYLLFTTTLSGEEFARSFANLAPCW
jgi:hypothetical protein